MNVLSLFSGCGGMDIGFEGGFMCLKRSINTTMHPEWIEEYLTVGINMINELDNYVLIAIPIISIMLLGISYLISNKIYQNKEF